MDWNQIEEIINQEIIFLKENILLSPFRHEDPIKCRDCLFRLISTLIVGGNIRVDSIKYSNDSFWSKNDKKNHHSDDTKNHGAFWHSNKIRDIKNYFNDSGLLTQDEPPLFYGRCDLGIENLNIFIEVGTINLYKLYLNILNMKKCKLVLVVSDSHSIVFHL